MSLQQLNILINDTKVGTTVLNIEKAERKALQLKYDGGDDEYKALIASQLSFNMVVEDAADAHFFHLFTGEETRYEVQLEEADTNNLLWQGHLLPDQYSEPYEGGCFFVNFTATDGLGILKNKYLPADFYKETKSIPKILGACLQLTANQFHMIIAPAIENAAKDLYVVDQEIDTSLFINDNKKKNAYEILESLVTAMGCNLFQYAGYWYIIGINRKNDTSVDCEFYSLSGNKYVADNITSFSRTITSVLFEENPQITAIPPFKTVVVNWDTDFEPNIFPAELFSENKQSDSIGFSFLDNWQVNGSEIVKFASESANPYAQIDEGAAYYLGIYNVFNYASIDNHYVSLATPKYFSVQQKPNGYSVSVLIEGVFWITSDPTTALENGMFDQKVLFELLLGNDIVLSNKATFNTSKIFNFDLQKGSTYEADLVTYYSVDFSLEVDAIEIRESGYWNVKLHPIKDSAVVSVIYKKFDVVVSDELDFNHTLNREIDYSTIQEVDIDYAFIFNDSIKNQFLISPFEHLDTPYVYTIPAEQKGIGILNFTNAELVFGADKIEWVNIDISEADYNFLVLHPNRLYVKGITGVFTKIPKYYISQGEASSTGFYLSVFKNDMQLLQTDEIYYKVDAETVSINDDNYMREAWKRVGTSENVSYPEALANMYHSTVRDTKFKIEGTLFGLFNPLSILQFRYITPKNYNPTTLTLKLDEGMTDVVMVESSNKEINDYE